MNKLTLELKKTIDKYFTSLSTQDAAAEALLTPSIYEKAGLIRKEDALFTKKQMCDAFIDGNTDAHRPVEKMFTTSNDWFEKKYPNHLQQKEADLISLEDALLWSEWTNENGYKKLKEVLSKNGEVVYMKGDDFYTTAQLFHLYQEQKEK